MKSYDETVDAVFDRIHAFEAKKKRRIALTHRVIAVCCAASLLCVSVWFLNHGLGDTPIGNLNDVSPSPITTSKKTLIIVDTEDTDNASGGGSNGNFLDGFLDDEFEGTIGIVKEPISPALKEKMEQYRDADVMYAVIAQVFITEKDREDYDNTSGFFETNEEMRRVSEEFHRAYDDYVNAHHEDDPQKVEKTSTAKAPKQLAKYYAAREEYVKLFTVLYGNVNEIESEAVRSRVEKDIAWLAYYDAMVEWRICISNPEIYTDEERDRIANHLNKVHKEAKTFSNIWDDLLFQLRDEYITALRKQRLDTLAELCDTAPIAFSSDTIQGYYAELTADTINTLAESGCYKFRMASPDGSVENDWYGNFLDFE